MKQLLIVNSGKALNATGATPYDLSGLEEGAITFFELGGSTALAAAPTKNFGIALGRANGQMPFVIPEVDLRTLTVTKATPSSAVAMKRTFTVPTVAAGKTLGVMLVKREVVRHERNTWTATVVGTGTPATDATNIKNAIDAKNLPFTVTVASAKVTITANNAGEQWEVVLTDALMGTAFSTTSGETADPVKAFGDMVYIQDLASRCAAGKGFSDTYRDGDTTIPGYPEKVENTTYNVYTLRFQVGRDGAKTRDEKVWQLVHIAVPVSATAATAINTILTIKSLEERVADLEKSA